MKKGQNQHGRPYTPATIKHQIVLLSRLYSLASKWGMFPGPNPCQKVKKPTLNNEKTEFLTAEELSRLLQTLNDWPDKMSVAIVKFALYTGLRRGEVFCLKWKDVDIERNIIYLRSPKGGKDVALPISNEAALVLQEVPRQYESPWIFYGKNGGQRREFKGPWVRIRAAANLPADFRFHGLRHHYASALANSGEVDLYVIQHLLGHKDSKMTQRYAHLAQKALREAAELSGKLLTANQPNERTTVVRIRNER